VDPELVVRAKAGDRAAFERIALESSDELYAIATGILRDREAAADALQNALVHIWQDMPTLREPDRFAAWARRVLVNRCYQIIRARRRWPVPVSISPVDAVVGDAERELGTRDEIERAFARLSPEQRAVVVMHYFRDRPQDEIAESLGISVGTVKSRLHHAKRLIRAAIEADARPTRQEGPAG
jgi:RNA polymerase sigma-70 factor (ECF subfamily)